jgi:hypothetical protein
MASEANYGNYNGEGYSDFIKQQKSAFEKEKNYENSEEFKNKIHEQLNKLEQYLVKNSYKKLQPGVDKIEKGKVYYIIQSNNLERGRVSVYPTKVTCIQVNPDGTGNLDPGLMKTKYNNMSLDSLNDNKNFYGIWHRSSGLNTVLGIGSASKYTAGKKIKKTKRKSNKSRKTIKSRKTRQPRRR